MQDVLLHLLDRCLSSEYADARYECRSVSELAIDERGVQLNSHAKNGGFCRIVGRHAAAHLAFTDPQSVIRQVDREARNVPSDPRSKIVPPSAHVAQVCCQKQPPLEERIDAVRQYHALLAGFKSVKRASLYFRQEHCRKFFVNCAGTSLDQDQQWTFGLLSALTQNGQWAVQVLGAADGLQEERAQVEQLGRWTESLLTARIPRKGRYTVVLDPQLAGAVIHETIGHLSEADNTNRSSVIQRNFEIGKRVGGSGFSVTDDASLPGFPGTYAFDDEGVPGCRTTLVREGVIVSKLHTLRTAAEWGAEATGNGRASDFANEPIVRCSNTIVSTGEQTTEELIESVNDGLYLHGVRGGRTYGDVFVYSVCGGNRIRHGRLAEPVGNVTIRCQVTEFLNNITGIGDRIPAFSSPFCIKKAQPWMPVWSGSPPLRVANVPLEV
jgi:predicted Zn-dependent protease